MRLKFRIFISCVLVVAILIALWVLIRNNSFDALQPAGIIADKQRDLLILASVLSAIVVIPVFGMTFWIVWKYRVGNQKAGAYKPDWHSSRVAEAVWWGIPLLLITVLGVIIWRSSHELDPYKPIASQAKPLTVQVIALQWKWLFIYPEQNVASVNFLQLPINRPVTFRITADSPMNSFWIPKLGGQIYAMNGMTTQLNLQAHTAGDYVGKTANISGKGYSDMTFTTRVGSEAGFSSWIEAVRASGQTLSLDQYNNLAKPSLEKTPILYASRDETLYDTVIMKYMAPSDSGNMKHH